MGNIESIKIGIAEGKIAVVCDTLEECNEFYRLIRGSVKGYNYSDVAVHNHCKRLLEGGAPYAVFCGYGGVTDRIKSTYKSINFKDLFRSDYEVELL